MKTIGMVVLGIVAVAYFIAAYGAIVYGYHWFIVDFAGVKLGVSTPAGWTALTLSTLCLTYYVFLAPVSVAYNIADFIESLTIDLTAPQEQEVVTQELSRQERERAEQVKIELESNRTRLRELIANPVIANENDFKLLFPHCCPSCNSRIIIRTLYSTCWESGVEDELVRMIAEDSRRFGKTYCCANCGMPLYQRRGMEGEPKTLKQLSVSNEVRKGDSEEIITETDLSMKMDLTEEVLARYKEVLVHTTFRYLSPYLTEEQSESIPDMVKTVS
jgi:hypothetical protein